MHSRFMKSTVRALALATLALSPVALLAQDAAKAAPATYPSDSPSKWDIFAGYSYLAPTGQVIAPSGISAYQAINFGGIVSGTRFFNNYIGAQLEVDAHTESQDLNPLHSHINNSNDDFGGGSIGLLTRFPSSEMTPFLHALVGTERVGGPGGQADTFGEVLTAGGGIDYALPFFHNHFSFRFIQADFQYDHVNFGTGTFGGRANVKAARLSSGLVYHIGSIVPPPPVTLACAVSPTTPIFPGDPLTVTATAGALNPKLKAVYTWTGTGVTGKDASASVATAGQAPGTYTVKAEVKEGPKPKPTQIADCSATYTVRDYDPPTISCVANPTSVQPGGTSSITATGVSPQNRPLTYSYSATAGTVTGSGSSATYSSVGAPTGDSTVTCSVVDDKGKTATATAVVTVLAPPPPPGPSPEQVRLEARLALHSIFFPTAQPREKTPNVGLVASQQATLATLATDFKQYLAIKPDAHLTLSGHADVRGSVEYNQALSDRRVEIARKYLVNQGIPEASLSIRALGKDQELTADQVKDLVEKNPDLTDVEKKKVLKDLAVIVLAQNRRVDVTLTNTGQQSVQLYPFNAADSLTLLDKKSPIAPAAKKAAAPAKKEAAPAKKK